MPGAHTFLEFKINKSCTIDDMDPCKKKNVSRKAK